MRIRASRSSSVDFLHPANTSQGSSLSNKLFFLPIHRKNRSKINEDISCSLLRLTFFLARRKLETVSEILQHLSTAAHQISFLVTSPLFDRCLNKTKASIEIHKTRTRLFGIKTIYCKISVFHIHFTFLLLHQQIHIHVLYYFKFSFIMTVANQTIPMLLAVSYRSLCALGELSSLLSRRNLSPRTFFYFYLSEYINLNKRFI